MPPLVTVITPSFNSFLYISEAVASVLNQTFKDWELIIIDGGSLDGTIDLIQNFVELDPRIKLIHNFDDCGPAHARAVGIDSATGKYIAFLDADDLWLPSKLEKQVGFMEQNNYSFTYTLYSQISADGLKMSEPLTAQKSYSYPQYLGCRGIGNLTVVVRRDAFTPLVLNTFKYRAEDTIWWLLIMKSGITAYLLPEVLASYRITPGSLSSQRAKNQSAVWLAYRKVFGLALIECIFYYSLYVVDALLRKLRLSFPSFLATQPQR